MQYRPLQYENKVKNLRRKLSPELQLEFDSFIGEMASIIRLLCNEMEIIERRVAKR